MHRFRKKQDLKKLEHNNNNSLTTKESQISTSTTIVTGELPTLPTLPPSDFRTSLILPTLTKRFSVLRRGEKTNNHNDTSKITSITQESPDIRTILSHSQINNEKFDNNITTINEVSKMKGRSPLSSLVEIPNEEKSMSGNSSSTISSITPPTSVNTSEVLSNARIFYDSSIRIQSTTSVNNNIDDNYNNKSFNENDNKNDKINIINEDINMLPVKNSKRISSNGLLVNPIKDRPKPPRTRPPSLLQVPQGYSWQNEFTTLSKNNNLSPSKLSLSNLVPRQISPTKTSPIVLTPRSTNFNNNEPDSFPQPASPRSPLDKLSEGLYNLQIHSSSSLSPSSPLYNTQNLSQTSLRSFGGSSVNDEDIMESPIKKSPSINSLRNLEENIYNLDRASTTSTIGSSLKRIRTVKTIDIDISNNSNNSNNSSNNHKSVNGNSIISNNDSIDNEGDDEAENEINKNSYITETSYLKNSSVKNDEKNKFKIQPEIQPEISISNMTNIASMQNNNVNLQKRPSRGGTAPPPKPQPPPLSLTDTLIASGQSDIAHQVMAMRRVQNVIPQQQLLPQHQFHTKQGPMRKWSKKNLKNISGPQLVSTSSNVKTIPIVQLVGQSDDDKLRKKRESETGIGKSLRRIKDVFTSDSESNLFGKKRTSLRSSNENLSRKFVSDENLNQKFINNEKRGLEFGKRRAFSTREKDKPDDKLKQDIRNNFTFIMNNDQQQQQLNGDDVYIPGDRLSTPINNSDKWTGQQPLYDIYALKRHAEMVTRYSNRKLENQLTTSRPSSQSSSFSFNADIPNESESVPSSPITPFSDSTSTPPPISPRNPLRQPDKSRIKYSTGSQNSISDTGSDEKRDSKDSKASSSRLMSIFSNRSSKSSTSRNSKNSDINHSQTNNNIEEEESHSKIIRRTIIITKPFLPPLPEDPAPSTPTLPPSKSALKKKISPVDGNIHASDDRQWFHSKDTSSNDDEPDNSSLLNIPIQKISIRDRPPTPIPSPNTRDTMIDLPYGIPIPPIPSPHRNSMASKTSKRTSKSSITSSLKSSSSKFNRKSIGNKSIYSTYGESIYDYYNYSDQEGDDEGDSNSTATKTTKRQQFEAQQHVEVLEMSDGSYVWQVVNGLRGEDMKDRYSYYYAGANVDSNGNERTYSQIWPQDFGRLNYGRDLEDDQLSLLSFNDQQRNDNLDSYIDDTPNSFQPSEYQKHGQYLTPNVIPSRSPNRITNEKNINSTVSTISNGEENYMPRTSVYFAKDVPLPKLLEEMSRGFGGVSLDGEESHYVYGGEVGAGGTGVVGEMTVEEKLDQVMRALGVADSYINE
ncbi:hypothetical protein GLOIN_2v1564941 [Rhizophagus irregularis DAOM 181602=DAOM 197198]|nr:hypothetical protein GLOIN_2v1564941 [Rhizophagus irregularis DAOM 181602=DAOM 197198]